MKQQKHPHKIIHYGMINVCLCVFIKVNSIQKVVQNRSFVVSLLCSLHPIQKIIYEEFSISISFFYRLTVLGQLSHQLYFFLTLVKFLLSLQTCHNRSSFPPNKVFLIDRSFLERKNPHLDRFLPWILKADDTFWIEMCQLTQSTSLEQKIFQNFLTDSCQLETTFASPILHSFCQKRQKKST